MAEELNDAEYAAMLVGGNFSLVWHSLDPKTCTVDDIDRAMKEAAYNAIRQVFSDRLKIELPVEMVDLFPEEQG
jgi:hypothetical protein